MLIILQILLMLTIGRCTDGPIFEAKTVALGQDVKLTCPRDISVLGKLFWIKLVSGNFPEILSETIALDYDENVMSDDRITAKQEPGIYVLDIRITQLSDTAVYYCVGVGNEMTFLKGTFLRIKGPESDVTAITRVSPSDPVLPEDVVNFQCSVLSAAKKTTCGEEHKLYWFKTGPADAHPSPVFASESSTGECSESGGGPYQQECVYSFSKSVASSDAGDYLCAVATCGLIVFGQPEKLNIQVVSIGELQRANTIIYFVSAALAISLIGTAYLIFKLKKKCCNCHKTALQTQAETSGGFQQPDENSLVYSAPIIIKKKTGKADGRRAKAAEENSVYADVLCR